MGQNSLGFLSALIIFYMCILSSQCLSSGNFDFTDSNQGISSHYSFSFTPSSTYDNTQLMITFPTQYSLSSFVNQLQCFTSQTGKNDDYKQIECWVQPDSSFNSIYMLGSVVMELQNLNPSKTFYILLKNVVNPQTASSSYFQLCLRKDQVKLQCNKNFAKASFTSPAIVSSEGFNIISNPTPVSVGKSQSYTFEVKLSSETLKYQNQMLSIRIKLPKQFGSFLPLCSIAKSYEFGNKSTFTQISSSILPATPNQVNCGPIPLLSTYLSSLKQLSIRIDNIQNPIISGTYSGIILQTLLNKLSQPIETIGFPISTIEIEAQNLQITIKQQNYMRKAKNTYYFHMNHNIDYNSNTSINIEFLNGNWELHHAYFIDGFSNNKSLQYRITNNQIQLFNFYAASKSDQQIFAISLTSSQDAGTYDVSITTTQHNHLIGQWSGIVTLNSTIGKLNLLSVSAVQPAVKLPVSKTGPLQLTFFLNYELPKSDTSTNGSLILSIFPQLPEPNPITNGLLKCYWKSTLQSSSCSFSNSSPNKTVITIFTPQFNSFQYSQLPIIITTQGGTNTENLGLTIDPLVQRYRFQCQFYLYNSTTIQSEVFYTTWIADAIQMSTATVMATTHQCNQQTHLQINLTTPLLDSSIQKQFRIMIQFYNAGASWAENIGYLPNQIYQKYPCLVKGLSGSVHCDLNTYTTISPYNTLHINNKYTGPFIIIYGFEQNVVINTQVIIDIPKIKISSNVGIPARIGISILEETPKQIQPFVQLFYQDVEAFVTKEPPTMSYLPLNGLPLTQVQGLFQYNFEWEVQDSDQVSFIVYKISPEVLPTLENKDPACQSSKCISFTHPANWIFQTPSQPLASPYSLLTVPSLIPTMPFISSTTQTNPVLIHTYNSIGQTLHKYQMSFTYIPIPITQSTFTFLQTTIHSGLEQWYQIEWTVPAIQLSDYPFLRFILRDGLSFSEPAQCNSTTIISFNQSGILCVRENPQSMRVSNIKKFSAGIYSFIFRLQTTQRVMTTPISPLLDIHINHNNSIDFSLVSSAYDISVDSNTVITPTLGSPAKFTISNPQIINQNIQIGYIGPVHLQFSSTLAGIYQINVLFHEHEYNGGYWRTPNSILQDPIVCMVNDIRYDCTLTTASINLELKITNVSLLMGQNTIKIDTQYIYPFNGIKHPDVPGMYLIDLNFNQASVDTTKVSFYAQIDPPSFLHMQAESIVKDAATQSIYIINFTIPNNHIIPNEYSNTNNFTRIFIQFPTKIGNQIVFGKQLGGYSGIFGQRVGCYFKKGSDFIQPQTGKLLQCRLIPSRITGEPVKVQIINFGSFATKKSLSVYIFKIVNPTYFNSVPITVSINHVSQQAGSEGNIYPLYKQTYRIFLDPRQPITPPIVASTELPDSQLFQSSKKVGSPGYITIKAETIVNTNPSSYYMLVKLPPYLQPQNDPAIPAFPACSTSFIQCVSAPEIQYLLVKATVSGATFSANLKNLPISTSQTDSLFYSNIIENGRLTGIIKYTISASHRWKQIRGIITLVHCKASGLQQKIIKNKKNFNLEISFITNNLIPETGTIQIGFPSSITNVQPHCRSSVELSSALISQSGTSGQIGCMVQNNNKWVITGFSKLPANSNVIISGKVDLPNNPSTIGIGHITTYSDNNILDIHTNGSIIDHSQFDFQLILTDTLATNANENFFMTQKDVIRQNYVGQFKILISNAKNITTTDTIGLKMWNTDIRGTAGGFSTPPTGRDLVCEFIKVSNNQKIGCLVLNTTTQIASVYFILKPVETLQSSLVYQIRLTTQAYSYPIAPQGIPYPTVSGIYKIQTITTISSIATTQHSYIESYGPSFSELKITQYNYKAGEYNLLWIQLKSTLVISIKQQIILQFPTRSNNGSSMFQNNFGMPEIPDGGFIGIDIFDSLLLDNTFMKCRLFHGDFLRSAPVKIICGQFTSPLPIGAPLKFALAFRNPQMTPSPSIYIQTCLPVIIYSYNPFLFKKTSFNLVSTAVYINNQPSILVGQGSFSTASGQLQFPNDQFYLESKHTNIIQIGDAFVIRLNFPLRVNNKKTNGCQNMVNNVFGDAYYHQNLRVIVCKVTTLPIPIPATVTPVVPNMKILNFYTPWYRLSTSEVVVYAIASYNSKSKSEMINYGNFFPHLEPRSGYMSTQTAVLDMIGVLGHNVICQRDDYIFKVTLESGSTQTDLQYTKQISIHFPLVTQLDLQAYQTDCVEDITSQIQIIRCDIDLQARAIYVQIVPGLYQNGQTIAIRTLKLAVNNPCTVTAMDITKFVVRFYSWENVTDEETRAINQAYLIMDVRNIMPTSIAPTFIPEAFYPGTYAPFSWIKTPHERSYTQFAQFKSGQYSPFIFELILTSSLIDSPPNVHKLTLVYGNNFNVRALKSKDDLFYDKPVCYLRNTRIQKCVLDDLNKLIYMQFNFGLVQSVSHYVEFSILDSRNPQRNGFEYVGPDGHISKVTIKLQDGVSSDIYVFETMPFPAKQIYPIASDIPKRGITFGTIDWATNFIGEFNVLEMTLYVSRNDISALQFEIPLVNQVNTVMYSTNFRSAFFNLNDGNQYPCGNNNPAQTNTGNPKCYIFNGQNTEMGVPTLITMFDLTYSAGIIKARIILSNPDVVGSLFTIKVKAYTGISTDKSVFGQQYVGYWNFVNVFQAISGALSSYPFHISYLSPSRSYTYVNSTSWTMASPWGFPSLALGQGGFAILQILVSKNLENYCQINFPIGDTSSNDMLILKSKATNQIKAYFIKKTAGASWIMNYFKCKHYVNPFIVRQYQSQISGYVGALSMSPSYYVSALASAVTINNFEIIQARVLLEINMNSMMISLISNGFVWDNQQSYVLVVALSNSFSGALSQCFVTGGFINRKGQSVSCTSSTYSMIIRNFQEILKNSNNQETITLQAIGSKILTGYTAATVTVYLYANEDAYSNGYYITYTTSAAYSRSLLIYENQAYYSTSTYPAFQLIQTNYVNQGPTQNLNIDFQEFSVVTATRIKLKMVIKPMLAITLNQVIGTSPTTYLTFNFFFQGYQFTCTTFNSLTFTFNSAGTNYPLNAMSFGTKTCGVSSFQYRSFSSYPLTSLGGGNFATFSPGQTITVEGELNVATAQQTYLKDWIGVRAYITTQVRYYTFSSPWNYYYSNSYRNSHGQKTLPTKPLATSLQIDALSKTILLPTQLKITISSLSVPVTAITNKILLIEFQNIPNPPFNYLNSTTHNQQIQCICQYSSTAAFTSITNIDGAICQLRRPALTFINYAITLDIFVPQNSHLRCWFPGWLINSPSSITATAKLLNKGSSYAPFMDNTAVYGGLYWISTAVPLMMVAQTLTVQPLSIYEEPNIYDIQRIVNTQYFLDYKLVIDTQPSTMTDPYAYIEFNEGSFIASSDICTNGSLTFPTCRVYNKLRSIIVAQFSVSVFTNLFNFTKAVSKNLAFPKHKGPNTNLSVNVWMRRPLENEYSFHGQLIRNPANLIVTPISLTCFTDQTTGTDLVTQRTNLILSFNLGGQAFYSSTTYGSKITLQSNITLANLGCSASSIDDPLFDIECDISGNMITLTNPSISNFSVTAKIQVIVGITNPNDFIEWTVKAYEYTKEIGNYGQQSEGKTVYMPREIIAPQSLQKKSQVRMYPFNTKVMSSVHSPLRIAFKLNETIAGSPIISYSPALTTYFVLYNFPLTPFTNFECFFKEYSNQPADSLSLPRSHRSWKQQKQHLTLYTNCYNFGGSLKIQPPRLKEITKDHYYELVVMPVGPTLSQTGFTNMNYALRFYILPNFSQYIGRWQIYESTSIFELDSIYFVTSRPLQSNSLMIKFNIKTQLLGQYPDHYIDIHFRDMDMSSLKVPYNQNGVKVPCTLSVNLIGVTGRSNTPKCIINKMDAIHGDLVLRIVEIGDLPATNYNITFDDFLNPKTLSMLQQSNPFSVCLAYEKISTDTKHQKCFQEILIIDGINKSAPVLDTGLFPTPSDNKYRSTISGQLQYTYGMTSVSTIDQKAMIKIQGGYSATTPSPLSFSSHQLLWFNPQLNMYILKQPIVTSSTPYTITMQSLINPEPYLMTAYSLINLITITYYDQYHPAVIYQFEQPPFDDFIIQETQTPLSTTVLNDISGTVPISTNVIIKLLPLIKIDLSQLKRKLDDTYQITFTTGVQSVQQCWVSTVDAPLEYSLLGTCQISSSNRILLRNFYQSNTNHNLTIFARIKFSSQTLTMVSKLYSLNGKIQYNSTVIQTTSKVNVTSTKNILLTFTQNLYTDYYFEQAIVPVVMGSKIKNLNFLISLPQNMLHEITVLDIQLPIISPFDFHPIHPLATQTKLLCEWLRADLYNRKFHTGVFSHCVFSPTTNKILVNSPYGGLLANQLTSQIPYLLKIRQLDPILTQFRNPTTTTPIELKLVFNNTGTFTYDTLLIQPNNYFPNLKIKQYNLGIAQHGTYHIEWTPNADISLTGTQFVLQLSFDSKYLPLDLGMKDVYQTYGVDFENTTRINNIEYNVNYDVLGNKWINGMPYTSHYIGANPFTPNATTIHTGSGNNNIRSRITLLQIANFLTGANPNVWRIPLILNPSTANIPIRMNLTLWSYTTANLGIPCKQLFYEIINHKYTKIPTVPTTFTYSLQNSPNNRIQTNTIDIGVNFTSITNLPSPDNFMELKFNNHLVGITDIPDLISTTLPSNPFIFYFFHRVNILLAVKDSNPNISPSFIIGTASSSNEYADYYGYDWIKVYGQEAVTKKAGPVSALLNPCSTTTPTVFLISEGQQSKNSQIQISLTFSTDLCFIPKNSTLSFEFSSSVLQPAIKTPCYSTFIHYSCINYPNKIQINFSQRIDPAQTVILKFYLRAIGAAGSSTAISAYIYGIPNVAYTKILDFPALGTISVINDTLGLKPIFKHIQTKHIYQNTQMDIRGTISTSKPLTPTNTFKITHPFPSTIFSIPSIQLRRNVTSQYEFDQQTQLNWFRSTPQIISEKQTIYTIPTSLPQLYTLEPSNQFTFIMSTTYDPTPLNNYTIGPVSTFYQFQYETNSQIAYHEVYPQPIPNQLIIINPYKQIGQQTVLGFKFTINHQIKPGHRINVQLDTNNLKYDMFKQTSDNTVECVQKIQSILTDDPHIKCQITQKPTSLEPNKPIIITLYPTKTVPISQVIQFYISPIFNPTDLIVAGATVRIDINCNGKSRCTIYEATGYYRTVDTMGLVSGLSGTWLPSQTDVLTQNIDHTFTLVQQQYNLIFFRYPENYNKVMPPKCTSVSATTCLIFPSRKQVALIFEPPLLTDTITLSSMNNPIYMRPQIQFINLVGITSTSANLYQIQHGNLTTRKQTTLNSPTTMTIKPTQTNNIFLRNYLNTVEIQITGIYSSNFIQAFYINAPVDIVTWSDTYCNATIQSLTPNPYPTRLTCSQINDTTIQILIPSAVTLDFIEDVTQEYVITIHAKIFIQDFLPGQGVLYVSPPVQSGTFNAYGSFSNSNASYAYYITEASTTIMISQHRVPIIGNAEFNTESFSQRIPNVNEKTNFELLIDPTTTQQISRIEVIIPNDFDYPPVQTHDACQLISTLNTPITNCYQTRNNGKTILSLQLPSTYNNGPINLKLGSKENWFTAPSTPGSWYNFDVLLYSPTGTLLESQTTTNTSEIGGIDLSIPDITIINGLDEKQNQIIDITFIIGELPVPKGHNFLLSTGQYYSYMKITFENVDASYRTLGLNILSGEPTGCVTYNIPFSQQITCKLKIGEHIDDKPQILITGYQQIPANTSITLSLANILNLPANSVSTLSISIVLKRIGDTRQSYLYNPTSKVLASTSIISIQPLTNLELSYGQPKVVGMATIFNINITPPSDITHFVLKFPNNAFNNEYSLFNPTSTSASKIETYYRSNVMRIYPSSTHLANQPQSYTIINFPTPQYQLASSNFTITFQSYLNNKLKSKVNYTITNLNVSPCKLSLNLLSISSPYTLQSNVTYVIQYLLKPTNLQIQTDNKLTLGLWFEGFSNLRQMGVSCFSVDGICRIGYGGHIEIEGVQQSGKMQEVIIKGISNPNTLNYSIIASTYNSQNLEKLICSEQTFVTLFKTPTFTCQLSSSTSQSSFNSPSIYSFNIQCPNLIKNQSTISIKISNNIASNNLNNVSCWSNILENLSKNECLIAYINGSYYIKIPVVTINKNQNIFKIFVKIINPIVPQKYNFTAKLLYKNNQYANTTSSNIQIINQPIKSLTSIELINLPTQSGQPTYLIFKIPTAFLNNTLQISFPFEFQIPNQVKVTKYVQNHSSWAAQLNYSDILKLQNKQLTNSVYFGPDLSQTIRIFQANQSIGAVGSWTYFLIDGIKNPAYQSSSSFTINVFYNFNPQQKLLTGTFEGILPYLLSPPVLDIVHTDTQVLDNDILTLTTYELTYNLLKSVFTNRTSLIISPPLPQTNKHLQYLNYCISFDVFEYCGNCQILSNSFKLNLNDGLQIPSNTNITIKLTNIWTPSNASSCSVFNDHMLAYFGLQIVKNGRVIIASTSEPKNMMSPCVQYRLIKADILGTFPNIVYAGMVHPFTISLSSPTKMLRVILNSSNPSITFSSNNIYFSNYNTLEISGNLIIASTAQTSQAYINITHDESGSFNLFRPNLPILIQVMTNHTEYVQVQLKSYSSIGYKISVPITVSLPSSVDMYIQITLKPNTTQVVLQSSQVLIPAYSKTSQFIFWYEGTTVPPTVNLSMRLSSGYPLFHILRPTELYLHFGVSEGQRTLPPILQATLTDYYRDNSQFIGRKVYHIDNTGYLLYDDIKPMILKIQEVAIGSTSASFTVYTRDQCTIAYVIYPYGDQFDHIPDTPSSIMNNIASIKTASIKNSTFIVNPYGNISFLNLKQQTKYFIYLMAFNSLGLSVNFTSYEFETSVLSNAIKFNIVLRQEIEKDQVKIVRVIAEILAIDPSRVRVISSQKLLLEEYAYNNYLNQQYYSHQIVISPSTESDILPATQLLTQKLIQNTSAHLRLQELLPNWIGTFNESDMTTLNRNMPKLKQAPVSSRISYYNATFTVKYWNQVKVYAILIEIPGQTQDTLNFTKIDIIGTPIQASQLITANQIVQGVNYKNEKAFAHSSSLSSQQGDASLFFDELRPGSKYIMYMVATNPEVFEPRINGDEITKTEFFTLWNPNLHNPQKLILNDLKELNPKLYEAINQFYNNADIKSAKGIKFIRK